MIAVTNAHKAFSESTEDAQFVQTLSNLNFRPWKLRLKRTKQDNKHQLDYSYRTIKMLCRFVFLETCLKKSNFLARMSPLSYTVNLTITVGLTSTFLFKISSTVKISALYSFVQTDTMLEDTQQEKYLKKKCVKKSTKY